MLNVNRFPDCLSRMMSVRTSPNLVEFVFIDNLIVGRGDLGSVWNELIVAETEN